jgi:hypothetical protein
MVRRQEEAGGGRRQEGEGEKKGRWGWSRRA